MTAPESSPLGSAKPAEAIAREWAKALGEITLPTMSQFVRVEDCQKARQEVITDFLLNAARAIYGQAAAAIQRSDGQTLWRPKGNELYDAIVNGEAPPAAKPDETAGATPRTDAAIYEEDTGYNGMVKVVSPDFARQLERELNAVRAAGAEAAMRDVNRLNWLDQDSYRSADLVRYFMPITGIPTKDGVTGHYRAAVDAAMSRDLRAVKQDAKGGTP